MKDLNSKIFVYKNLFNKVPGFQRAFFLKQKQKQQERTRLQWEREI